MIDISKAEFLVLLVFKSESTSKSTSPVDVCQLIDLPCQSPSDATPLLHSSLGVL